MNKTTTSPLKGSAGFTLVEIIASLMIVGVLAALVSTGIARIVQGYSFTRDNTETSLKGQVAITRIFRELRSLDAISSGSGTAITYDYIKDGATQPNRTLSWDGTSGSPLLLGGNTLVDAVDAFSLTYHTGYSDGGDAVYTSGDKIISVSLQLAGAQDTIANFSTQVTPRNLE